MWHRQPTSRSRLEPTCVTRTDTPASGVGGMKLFVGSIITRQPLFATVRLMVFLELGPKVQVPTRGEGAFGAALLPHAATSRRNRSAAFIFAKPRAVSTSRHVFCNGRGHGPRLVVGSGSWIG